MNTENMFLAFLVLHMYICDAQNIPLITIAQGTLRGKIQYDRKNGTIYTFQSVPFAKPPTGNLRFKAPEAPEPWIGIRDATIDLPLCIQLRIYEPVVTLEGQEDCLYLNIYTPHLPENGETLKPVMVFIHGGDFVAGSGRQDIYSPEFLLTEDIVLVTINYRLGILGSFSLEDESMGVPGNAGMKDQIMALTWIQNNVVKFGGDPSRVTVFGESAGGVNVHLLILSPMSEGLFQRAIAQSGSAIAHWVLGLPNSGIYIAKNLGIQTQNLEDTLATLRNISAETLVRAQDNIDTEMGVGLEGISNPIIEKHTSEVAFLSDDPYVLIETGNYNQLPFMIGYNNAEGMVFAGGHLLAGEYNLTVNFDDFIPRDLQIPVDSEIARNLSEEIKRFYFGESLPTVDNIQSLMQIYTDIHFSYPAYRATIAHARTSAAPTYFYRFSADTKMNVYKLQHEALTGLPGATHCDELGYLFYSPDMPTSTLELEPNSIEDLAIARIVKLWTNFAKNGTPTPDNFTEFKWDPVTPDKFNYANIETHGSTLDTNPDYDNLEFWSNIYATHLPSAAATNTVFLFVVIICILINKTMM